MANAITKVITMLHGEMVGTDEYGNKYYQHRKPKAGQRRRRWVIYKEEDEASRVPAEHHAWLHYTIDDFPEAGRPRRDWQKDHQANVTGSVNATLPPGHVLKGGQRDKATGDYEAWQPE